MPFSVSVIKLLEEVEPSLRRVLIALLEEIERQREESVTKKEFNELKEIVRDLAKAQKKTEQRLDQLARAQEKTEQRLDQLARAQEKTEQRLDQLAKAQEKTEQRLDQLAKAQEKTEQRLDQLARAQEKTEQRLDQLAEAQKRTEEELRKLIGEHRKTREQLGGLTHTVGYVLEDRAYKGLPALLERDFNVQVTVPLKRDFIELGPGKYREINIIGRASRNGEKIWILGDCKTQLKRKDVDSFIKLVKSTEDILHGDKILIMVTYQTSPQVRKYVESKGMKLYFSYEFPL